MAVNIVINIIRCIKYSIRTILGWTVGLFWKPRTYAKGILFVYLLSLDAERNDKLK